MAVPYGESAYIYGLHDRGGEKNLTRNNQARGWVLVTEEIRANPNDRSGGNYKSLADKGFGVIVRLNYAYGNEGTIPHSSQYDNFARRAANFARNSKGAHIWLIGNEMNLEREQPRGQRITPRLYAECYKKCRTAIKAVPGRQNDQVIVGAIGPWNGETSYPADPQGMYIANQIPNAPSQYPYQGFFGDFIKYMRDMLLAIGPQQCDGMAIHAYSHGYDPKLIFSKEKMGAPFQKYYFHFRTYQDQMTAIPFEFRQLPVYLTEANGDKESDGSKWPNKNSGWIKNAYREINRWNQDRNHQIRAVILYRWSRDDDWNIDGKRNVQRDLKEAVAKGYKWIPDVPPKRYPQELRPVVSIQIQDISATLPTNPALPPYGTRSLLSIRQVVINHTATPPGVTPLRIAQYQVSNERRPRPGIAYHFCITAAGEVFQTQPLTVISEHAGQFSAQSVGVSLIGNFTDAPPPEAQLNATAALLAKLTGDLNLPLDGNTVVGYSELAVTASPGATWPAWKPVLLEKAQAAAAPPIPGYLANYLSHNVPATIKANQSVFVDIMVENIGLFTWTRSGVNPFRLGFKWFNAQGQAVILPAGLNFRTDLPQDVASNQTVRLKARLQTPPTPGAYRLRWDMVHEQVTWFGDQGDPGLELDNITITPADTVGAPVVGAPSLDIQIQDISATLPTNPTLPPYPTRPLTAIRRFVINHTATPPGVTPLRIAQYQVSNERRPRPGIAYHFCITAAGEVFQTQPLTVVSNHAGQDSFDSVGLSLIGNFTDAPPPQSQLNATASVLAKIAARLGLPVDLSTVFGYSDLAVTASPGATWPAWKDSLISLARQAAGVPVVGPVAPIDAGAALPAGKTIKHYMLLWRNTAQNWAEWDLVSAIDYIGAFGPTVGFSVEEAQYAEYVTIVGGASGVPAQAEQQLQAAGCKVQRLNGATQEETNRMLYDLIEAGRPFRPV